MRATTERITHAERDAVLQGEREGAEHIGRERPVGADGVVRRSYGCGWDGERVLLEEVVRHVSRLSRKPVTGYCALT